MNRVGKRVREMKYTSAGVRDETAARYTLHHAKAVHFSPMRVWRVCVCVCVVFEVAD